MLLPYQSHSNRPYFCWTLYLHHASKHLKAFFLSSPNPPLKKIWPWPVCLSLLEHFSIREGLRVQFLVKAHAWVLDLIPGPGVYDPLSGHIQEATNRCFSLASKFLSLLSSLSESNEKQNVLRWGLKKKSGNNSVLFFIKGQVSSSYFLKIYIQEWKTSDSWPLSVAEKMADWMGRKHGSDPVENMKKIYGSSFKQTWAYTTNFDLYSQGSMHALKPVCDAGQKSLHWIPKWIAILVLFYLFPKDLNAWSQC